MSPGRAERHGFEYYRHGTRSLLAALDTQTGEVRGKTLPRIGGEPFLAFLKEIVASQPPQKEIHVIADNLSSHKTKRVKAELWSKVGDDMIRRRRGFRFRRPECRR